MRLLRTFSIHACLLAQLLVVSFAFATDTKVDIITVQDAIEERNLSWTAGENGITLASDPERKDIAGLIDISAEIQEPSALWSPGSPVPTLPDSLDWRDVQGRNWVGSVEGPDPSFSSCLSTTLRNIEDLVGIAENDPSLLLNLTADPLESGKDTSGASLVEIQDHLMLFGASIEDSEATYVLDSWEWITGEEVDVEAIKQAVFRGPIITTMRLFEDFLFYAGGVYESLGMNYMGLHLVRIVGWENTTRSWIIQNTWGEDWGEDGYARVHWDDPVSRIGSFSIIHHVSETGDSDAELQMSFQNGDSEEESNDRATKRAITFLKKTGVKSITSAGDMETVRTLNDSPIVINGTSVTLSWDPSDNASWYVLELNTDPNWDEAGRVFYGNIGSVTTKEFQGLEENVTYYWRVWAANDLGLSTPAVGPVFSLEAAVTGPLPATIDDLVSGTYVTEGKGKNKTTAFVPTDVLDVGDTFVLTLYIHDQNTGLPLSNASLDIRIQGPDSVQTSTLLSDADGLVTFTWQTSAPNKKGLNGTTPGIYTATVTNLQFDGYVWEQGSVDVIFTLQ